MKGILIILDDCDDGAGCLVALVGILIAAVFILLSAFNYINFFLNSDILDIGTMFKGEDKFVAWQAIGITAAMGLIAYIFKIPASLLTFGGASLLNGLIIMITDPAEGSCACLCNAFGTVFVGLFLTLFPALVISVLVFILKLITNRFDSSESKLSQF